MLCRGSLLLIDCDCLGSKDSFIQIEEMDRKELSGDGLKVGKKERD